MRNKYYVPPAMMNLPNWVLWKLEENNGRMTKIPYQRDGLHKASSIGARTWCSYADAVSALHDHPEMSGLGFVIEKRSRIVFIDIDHCIDEDGEISDTARDILSAFRGRSYAEVSQSGSGLHILTLGEIPRSFKNSKTGVEMYSDGRYVAFTGDAMIDRDLEECPDALRYVFDKYKTEKPEAKTIKDIWSAPLPVSALKGESDIISKASRHGRFASLYNGDFEKAGYRSQSEADLALCITIAYWCDRNPETIDRVFRSSCLYRPKWEREDYRNATIVKACSRVTESFTEWKEKKQHELIETLRSDWD